MDSNAAEPLAAFRFGVLPTMGVVLSMATAEVHGAWEMSARCSKLHSALLNWYFTRTMHMREQSKIHISEDWGNWRGASTGSGRMTVGAKLGFVTLSVGKG